MIRIDTDRHLHGLQVVRIENQLISLNILPEMGAKIYDFVHRASNNNLLWHNPRILPARQPFGSRFDDVWSGGWDELIPNDLPTPTSDGEMLPDHGEVWSQASEWTATKSDNSGVSVRFVNYGHVLPTVFEKTVILRETDLFCTIRYRFANLGSKPIDFLWNIHPALQISAGTRIDVPARRGIVDPWRTDQFEAYTEYEWPYAVDRQGRKIDLRKALPEESSHADHHYLPNVSQGWYAVTDTEKEIGFGLVFPTTVFPHLWLFRTFGGWRGLNTIILEASTGYPNDLALARQGGHCGHLEPHEAVTADVRAVVYTGAESVRRIDPDGRVVAGP